MWTMPLHVNQESDYDDFIVNINISNTDIVQEGKLAPIAHMSLSVALFKLFMLYKLS